MIARSVRAVSVLGLVVVALLQVAARAEDEQPCNYLVIALGPTVDTVPKPGECKYGRVTNDLPVTLVGNSAALRGPDCQVAFLDPKTEETIAVGEFQQNLCYFEAGDISVRTVSGRTIEYTTTPGKYPSTAGLVTVTGFASEDEQAGAEVEEAPR